MGTAALWPWIGFTAFVFVILAIDLGVFHRKIHAISLREALLWSFIWITLAMMFNVGLYFFRGGDVAIQFFTGYLVEKSLSVDNIFVFTLLFAYFNVPVAYQYRVLFWGIVGALIMRGILIAVGAVLLEDFHWIVYVFGAFLIVSGIRMGVQKETEVKPERNPLFKLMHRIAPVTPNYERNHFLVRRDGRLMITPLLIVLVIIESTDLVFAVDSIPAVFAVTNDPFIVYTSNIFAILGLRSLYFVFANVIDKFHYLKIGLAVILSYVGVKMLLENIYAIPTLLSLVVIACVLLLAIIASIVRVKWMVKKNRHHSENEKSSSEFSGYQ